MAGVQIGALHVSLSADSAAFDQGMNNAQQTADDSMSHIGDNAKKLAGVLAGLFAVDLIKDRIKEQIDYADGLADVAARANSTAEALSAMEYALHFNDATLEDYTGGLQKLSLNMEAAAEGSKAQAKLFETIGISLRDQDGQIRNAADVMLDFSDVLASMDDGATKTSLAMDVLGKSAGPALLPHLNQGSAAIKELTAEAQKFNLVVSTDASNAAGQLNDSLDKIGFAATGAWRVLAVQLAPTLGSISENMLKGAQDTKVMEGAAVALSTAIKVMYTGFSVSVIELKALGELIGKISAVAVSAATGEFAQAAAIWNDNSWKDKAKVDLLALGDVWQDAGKKATDSADAQAEAQAKSARTLELEKALAASAAADKAKKSENPKDNFQYGGLSNASDEYQGIVNSENLSIINFNAQEEIAAAQFSDMIDSMLVELDAAQTIAGAQWEEFLDSELVAIDAANVYKKTAQNDFVAAFIQGDLDRVNAVVTNGDAELEARKAQMAATVTFFHAGLASMAQGHGKAAKAAQAIQKAQALYEIGVNTYRAAMGAYAALAPIPFVGPALGVAAAAAAIAMGASMAQGVLSGGGGAGAITGSAPPALSNTGAPTSQAEQRQTEQQNQQVTYLRIGENDVLLGRTLLDLVGGALADNGGEIKNLRIIPA
jgi:hypothetical protein